MIKITADSTCDLSQEILQALDITLAPLHVLIGDKDYRDGIDIEPKDIFQAVSEEGQSCRTAAVNIAEYEQLFASYASQAKAVIHISLGSDFSSCFQNATLAAQQFDNVYVIDSQNLSTGSGHVVYDAAWMAKEGMEPEEICERLKKQVVPAVEASFVINRMDYLRKGGRCSGIEALGATLLQIKPSIEVVDGKMIVGKKYRGNFERCLQNYVRDRLDQRNDIDPSRIFITHAECSPDTISKVKEAIQRYADFDEIIETSAGSTISTHCGPNTLGILFKRRT